MKMKMNGGWKSVRNSSHRYTLEIIEDSHMKTIMMNSDILNKGELSPNKFLSPKAHKVSLQDK